MDEICLTLFLVILSPVMCAEYPFGIPGPSTSLSSVPENWINQKLDHFNIMDDRYFQQRYFKTEEHYSPGGPVFLFIGAEDPYFEAYALTGSWLEYARVHRAMCFALEHRYYGKSRPTPDLNTFSLRFLTVEQALDDLATFITAMNKEHNFHNSKWILFGGSYAGMLSAWMRYKFPHLVTGAVAHSAPLPPPLVSTEFLVGVGEALRTEPGCYESVSAAFAIITNKLRTVTGVQELRGHFRLCQFDMFNKLDVQNVLFSLIMNVATTVMFNNLHMDALGLTSIPVTTMCGLLTDESRARGDPLKRLADFVYINSLNYTYIDMTGTCQPVTFNSTVEYGKVMDYENNKSPTTSRQWTYQWCTQIGVFITSQAENQPFGHGLTTEYSSEICKGYFGKNFNMALSMRGNEHLRVTYGGLNIKATNVIYTQGTFDPYHKYGFMKAPNPKSPVVVIPGVGHVADIFGSSPNDSPALKRARMKIQSYIGQILTYSN